MKTGEKGFALIRKFEGLRLTAYQCAAGVWTLGYGHTSGVKKGQTITSAQAEAYLKIDVERFEKAVNALNRSFTQNQFDALVSFSFNCGENNLKTLCANRTTAEIADALLLYNKAGGKILTGLVARRKAERELFLTDSTTTTTGGFDVSTLSTIQSGSTGAQVKSLQLLLNGKNSAGLTVDGIAGAKTVAAIKAYQKVKNLTADGIVGINTWTSLLTV